MEIWNTKFVLEKYLYYNSKGMLLNGTVTFNVDHTVS